jgi:hypothetical protein
MEPSVLISLPAAASPRSRPAIRPSRSPLVWTSSLHFFATARVFFVPARAFRDAMASSCLVMYVGGRIVEHARGTESMLSLSRLALSAAGLLAQHRDLDQKLLALACGHGSNQPMIPPIVVGTTSCGTFDEERDASLAYSLRVSNRSRSPWYPLVVAGAPGGG